MQISQGLKTARTSFPSLGAGCALRTTVHVAISLLLQQSDWVGVSKVSRTTSHEARMTLPIPITCMIDIGKTSTAASVKIDAVVVGVEEFKLVGVEVGSAGVEVKSVGIRVRPVSVERTEVAGDRRANAGEISGIDVTDTEGISGLE